MPPSPNRSTIFQRSSTIAPMSGSWGEDSLAIPVGSIAGGRRISADCAGEAGYTLRCFMTEVSDPRIGTLLEGRYRLDQRLAAGGMGVVYKGELVAIAKPVAIKFLHDALTAIPDLVKRFQREALAMSRLAHPHLVSVIDSGLTGGVPFLVMDFVSGRSLAEVLNDGPVPATRAPGLGQQIRGAVRHAHASGVVHRDLKPDNIILLDGFEGDFVKILDFGLAKVVAGSESGATQLTNTGFALGTPGYM